MYRHETLDHMRRLWNNWRGILKQNSIKAKGGLEHALEETPNDLIPEDWHWLVTEHYLNPEFQVRTYWFFVNMGGNHLWKCIY